MLKKYWNFRFTKRTEKVNIKIGGGGGFPVFNFYNFDCNRPLASYTTTKMALSDVWCLLTAGWLLYVSNGIEIPGIQFQYQNRKYTEWSNTEYSNKSTDSNKALNEQKSNNQNWQLTTQALNGLTVFKSFNCDPPIFTTFKYLCVMELTIATLFCPCVSSWGISNRAAEFHFLPAGSLVVLWKIHETP